MRILTKRTIQVLHPWTSLAWRFHAISSRCPSLKFLWFFPHYSRIWRSLWLWKAASWLRFNRRDSSYIQKWLLRGFSLMLPICQHLSPTCWWLGCRPLLVQTKMSFSRKSKERQPKAILLTRRYSPRSLLSAPSISNTRMFPALLGAIQAPLVSYPRPYVASFIIRKSVPNIRFRIVPKKV